MEAHLAILDFLQYVVGGLVEKPDEVQIEHTLEDGVHVYLLHLHPDDAGRVIGRSGKTISSIRSLVAASAEKHGIETEVEVAKQR